MVTCLLCEDLVGKREFGDFLASGPLHPAEPVAGQPASVFGFRRFENVPQISRPDHTHYSLSRIERKE